MSQDTCPVFHPSEEEFCSFREYVERLECEYPGMGICKIIPPPSWKVRDIDIQAISQKVAHPVSQTVSGKHGVFQVELLESRTMSAAWFQKLALKSEYVNDDYYERERRFWKYILGNSGNGIAMYGADVPGSLFDGQESHPAWNLNNLDDLLRSLPVPLPGVNSPMLYFGSWRAMFAFHVEDVDLYSINYLHTGAAKSWYSIAPKDRRRFEQMAEKIFPTEYSQCHEFLRHKTKIFSPQRLAEERIPFQTALQHAGEFIITFPGSYHAGFNHGFNIAEATNFALYRWLDIGRMANVCACAPDSVRVDVNVLETIHIREIVRSLKNNVDIPGWAMRILPPNETTEHSKTTDGENIIVHTNQQSSSLPRTGHVMTGFKTNIVRQFGKKRLQSLENRLRCVCHFDVRYFQPPAKSIDQDDTQPINGTSPVADSDDDPHLNENISFIDLSNDSNLAIPVYFHSESSCTNQSNDKDTSEVEKVQCQDCWLWFHPECVRYYYSLQEKILPGMELAVLDISRCHVCHTIELFYSNGKRKRSRNLSAEKSPTVNKLAKKSNVSDTHNNSNSTSGGNEKSSGLVDSNKHDLLQTAQIQENEEDLYFFPSNNDSYTENKPRRAGLQAIPAEIIYSIPSSLSMDKLDR